MAKRKSFSDDGWAIWVSGDDVSTFYINEWINPQGKNYVDIAVRIRGVSKTHELNVYIPFAVEMNEIDDISHRLKEENVFCAIFSTRCVIDYMKNECTSELAYHGKTVDLVHLSKTGFCTEPLEAGTLVTVSIDDIFKYLDNDEAYFVFRVPHKNLDELFKNHIDMQHFFIRLRDLITSPVLSEKYLCSVRVNETRLLPEEINRIGEFHRQKLNKTVVTISIHEDYLVNDSNCYRIHRMESVLYDNYAPEGFNCEDSIIYEWNEMRDNNFYGHFNFYFGISRQSISKISMFLYVIVLLLVGVGGEILASLLGL